MPLTVLFVVPPLPYFHQLTAVVAPRNISLLDNAYFVQVPSVIALLVQVQPHALVACQHSSSHQPPPVLVTALPTSTPLPAHASHVSTYNPTASPVPILPVRPVSTIWSSPMAIVPVQVGTTSMQPIKTAPLVAARCPTVSHVFLVTTVPHALWGMPSTQPTSVCSSLANSPTVTPAIPPTTRSV